MNLIINGERVELRDAATVAEAVERAGVDGDGRGVAVAVAGEVVPRGDWGERGLRDGETVEVVHAVQGG